MKKHIITAGLLLSIIVANAQEPPKPPSLEERIKRTNEILQKDVQLNADQQKQVEAVFKNFFTSMDQLHKDNPPPPPPPPDPKVKEAMDKLVKERDENIKKILTETQYEKYQEATKNLHPPKPVENAKNFPPPQRQ